MLDTHAVGRTPRWFSRERASAFAILGEDLSQIDPLFERVPRSPRFTALNERPSNILRRQRTLREERLDRADETTALR